MMLLAYTSMSVKRIIHTLCQCVIYHIKDATFIVVFDLGLLLNFCPCYLGHQIRAGLPDEVVKNSTLVMEATTKVAFRDVFIEPT
jgi:hypothetical protein